MEKEMIKIMLYFNLVKKITNNIHGRNFIYMVGKIIINFKNKHKHI